MTFTPPDLSQILANEQEFNTRLNNLRNLVRNELDDLNTSYSSDDSIKSLVGKINNPPAWIIERSSTHTDNQLGACVKVTGCDYLGWNTSYPTPYADTDYWYLQSLSKASSGPSTAWGLFNTGNISPNDNFDLVVYGRSMENFNSGGFSGVGFSYGLPTVGSPMTGFYIGITLDSGTYRPAYAVFNNSTTPTITKADYGSYDSPNQKFRLQIIHKDDSFELYWYKGNEFLWNEWINQSQMPSGYGSADLKFGYVSYGNNLGRLSYLPRLYLSSPCRLNIL